MNYEKLFINGEWVAGESGEWIEVEDPYAMKVFARVPRGNAEDVDRAAKAASSAVPGWAATPLSERIALMENFLLHFRSREEEIIALEARELGAPISFGRVSHCEYQYTRVRSYIDLAAEVPMVEHMAASTTYREPVGVVGCVTPWNYPLGQVVQKVIPALLMGNTVVLKPSQQTPLSCYILAECFERAGFPHGTFNLVTGRGGEVGDAMAAHPLINMISFTGSTSGGVKVAQNALAGGVKRISLELGGKSPCILLPRSLAGGAKLIGNETEASEPLTGEAIGAYYEPAVRACFNTIFLNSGQTCTALSRLLIPENDKAAIEALMCRIVAEYTLGDPSDPSVKIGPVASMAQFRKIKRYIEKGIATGARLLCGGVPGEPTAGYFVAPTIFTDVDNKMDIAKDEIFGPVLCVISYRTLDEAVAIANDTRYGLNAAVWGPKHAAVVIAHRIQSGNVYINDSPRDCAAPFGGYKESGLGREGGVYGMLEFTQQKAMFDTCE